MIDEDEDDVEYVPSQPWNWAAAGGIVAMFASNLAGAVTQLFEDLSGALVAHANVDVDKRRAYEAMHRDLESL